MVYSLTGSTRHFLGSICPLVVAVWIFPFLATFFVLRQQSSGLFDDLWSLDGILFIPAPQQPQRFQQISPVSQSYNQNSILPQLSFVPDASQTWRIVLRKQIGDDDSNNNNNHNHISFQLSPSKNANESASQWCFLWNAKLFCSEASSPYPIEGIYRSQSGDGTSVTWKRLSREWITSRVATTVYKWLPALSQVAQSINEQLFLKQPATKLWITSQIALAYWYWSRRIPSSTVAKDYSQIMTRHEAWRCVTAATAHFELWHLAVNMLAFYELGQSLEGPIYTSLEFGLYTVSVIFWVGMLWLGLEWIAQQRFPSHTPARAVGFSGVLFAWMVIEAMHQSESCPLPFAPSVCFHAVPLLFGGMRFNWGPIIKLILLQMILPRVSFTGHLAGVITGFLMYWGFIPNYGLHPAIALPILYAIYMRVVGRPIQIERLQYVVKCTTDTMDPPIFPTQIMLLHVITLLASCIVLGPFHVLTLSYALFILWGCQSVNTNMLKRVFILTSSFALINDAITVASWACGSPLFQHLRPHRQPPFISSTTMQTWRVIICLMMARCTLMIASLVTAATVSQWDDDDADGGGNVGNDGVEQSRGIFQFLWRSIIITPSNTLIKLKNRWMMNSTAETSNWNKWGPGHRLGGAEVKVTRRGQYHDGTNEKESSTSTCYV